MCNSEHFKSRLTFPSLSVRDLLSLAGSSANEAVLAIAAAQRRY